MLAFRPDLHAVRTEVYDGPLELLLYLIRRDGIDVRDIPIAHVTREYLSFLDRMAELDLDVAGDFLVMAATLCQLKSRELIPRELSAMEEDEEDDPREQLARRLLEYQRFKEAAEKLQERRLLGREVFKRPQQPLDPALRGVDPGVDAFGLLEAFYRVLQEHAAEPPVHEVELDEYSMAERVAWVLARLDEWGESPLELLFERIHSRPQRILTFLALLEMMRLQMLDYRQEGFLGTVVLLPRISAADADLTALMDVQVAN